MYKIMLTLEERKDWFEKFIDISEVATILDHNHVFYDKHGVPKDFTEKDYWRDISPKDAILSVIASLEDKQHLNRLTYADEVGLAQLRAALENFA
jgi:hypothetical protein